MQKSSEIERRTFIGQIAQHPPIYKIYTNRLINNWNNQLLNSLPNQKYKNMLNLVQENISHISIDCIKTCPFQKNLVAMAYYQTNPTTQGAISVTHINQDNHLQQIAPI